MGISGVASQSMSTGSSSKKSDTSGEIKKLEQLKRDLQEQLKQLEQSKQGGDALKNAKDKLQKQMQEIDRQIQALKQQGTAETQPAEDSAKVNPPRFDEYVKNEKRASGTGIYGVEQDEHGNPIIVFDSPEKPAQEYPNTAKPSSGDEIPSSEDDKVEIMKCTVSTDKVDAEIKKLTEKRQSVQQQLNQAENPEEKAALQKQLANLETELRVKDNDAYRKQNASYTYNQES